MIKPQILINMKKIIFLPYAILTTIFFRQYKLTSSLSEYLKGDNWLDPDRTVYTYESNSRITIEYGLI